MCCVLCRTKSTQQPIGPTTTLGDLVERNQRAILLFYDEWVTPSGYKVGGKVSIRSLGFGVVCLFAGWLAGSLAVFAWWQICSFFSTPLRPPHTYTLSLPNATQFVPNQALWRIYGEGTSVDGKDPVTIDNQVSQGLLSEVVKQISAPQPALSPTTTWRIMGLFPSSCLVCRTAGVCGPISCADKVCEGVCVGGSGGHGRVGQRG